MAIFKSNLEYDLPVRCPSSSKTISLLTMWHVFGMRACWRRASAITSAMPAEKSSSGTCSNKP